MSAYLISERFGQFETPEKQQEYRATTARLIPHHGGRYLSIGGSFRLLEGDRDSLVTAIVEFPSMAAIEAFWNDPEYQRVVPLRRGAEMRAIAVDGVKPAGTAA
jgi:uncharacterized protein (DUF1330 family)